MCRSTLWPKAAEELPQSQGGCAAGEGPPEAFGLRQFLCRFRGAAHSGFPAPRAHGVRSDAIPLEGHRKHLLRAGLKMRGEVKIMAHKQTRKLGDHPPQQDCAVVPQAFRQAAWR